MKKNHLHFDVKSVNDSFDFFMNGKNMDNGYQIEWRSIDTQNQENLVVQPWHEFCQTIVGSKIFIIIAGRDQATWISIQKTTSFSSNNENTFTIKTRSRSSHKNSGLINLPRKLAFDNNRALREKPVFVFEYYEKKIGFNFQSHLHTKSSRVDKQFSFLSTLLYAKSSCANFTPL